MCQVRVLAQHLLEKIRSLQHNGGGHRDAGACVEQLLHHRDVARDRRLVEWCQAGGVLRVQVGGELDQSRQHRGLFLRDGEVERGSAEVGAVHTLVDVGPCGRQLPHDRCFAEGRGREQRVGRTMRQEITRDLLVEDAIETHRPAHDVQQMIGVRFAEIRTGFDQQLDDVQLTAFRREMDRIGVVAFIADIRVGALSQECSNDLFVVHAEVKGRPQAAVAQERATDVDQIGTSLEKAGNSLGLAGSGRAEQRFQVGVCRWTSRDRGDERLPVRVSSFARERVLHVAERGGARRLRVCPLETGSGGGIALLQRF